MHARIRNVAAALLGASLGVLPAVAHCAPDRDSAEVSAYKLTDAAFAKYVDAQTKLGALSQPGPDDCDSEDRASFDMQGKTIDQIVAQLDVDAPVHAAIKAAGLTTREYVVFGMAVFQAGMTAWAVDQPGAQMPAGTSMDNVNFYRKHETAIQSLKGNSPDEDCED